jgi:pimeloyl-ACP methyl ester carboxylesterase
VTANDSLRSSSITPFFIDVPDAVLDDLQEKLARTRFPPAPANAAWGYGTDRKFMERVVSYWRSDYDWRAVERRLNRFKQFHAEIEGYKIHFVYEKGSGKNPLPLVLTHGWPGSFVEFDGLIEPLAHPERFGGEVEDAFDVIVPSIPGYGWSSPPPHPISTREVARLWHKLMVDFLEYKSFVAQGGDYGSTISSWLGIDFPNDVTAIHINTLSFRAYTGEGSAPLDLDEIAWMKLARDKLKQEDGYQAIQGTKPQTLAFGLSDSPVGLAAWIIEKFHGWSGSDALEPPFSLEKLISNVMIYWVTNSVYTSTWLYTAARRVGGMSLKKGERVGVPTGFLSFPNDIFPPAPDAWVKRLYNLVRRTNWPSGGHFPAYEQPERLIEEIRSFFRDYRAGRS